MCKELNGPVLKSLKPKQSGLKLEKKKMAGLAHNKVLYFVFWPDRDCSHAGQPWLAPENSGSCRPLNFNQIDHKK